MYTSGELQNFYKRKKKQACRVSRCLSISRECIVAQFFPAYHFKTPHMSNSQNRSKDQSKLVKDKRKATRPGSTATSKDSNGKQPNGASPNRGSNKSSR